MRSESVKKHHCWMNKAGQDECGFVQEKGDELCKLKSRKKNTSTWMRSARG
jgi:hypothetical protein